MNARGPRIPLALRLAARLLPADAREEVLGDLLEHWSRHVRHRSLPARLAWAWRQPVSALAGRLRFRERGSHARGSDRRRRLRPAATARGTRLAVSWLDVKLGLRMLVKHPGVTLVVVFALGVGIPVSLAPHHFMRALLDTPLPFEDGEDIVGLVMWDRKETDQVLATPSDFGRWRDELTSFEAIGAARSARVNLITGDGAAAPAYGAAMTASAFAMTRVPPFLGRTLLPDDEVVGAPEVVVVGYDVWRARLAADPDVVGTVIRVAGVPRTVVGVMPEGFYFPSHHQVWWPLRAGNADVTERGPPVWVFGRLANGAPVEQAQAELTAAGQRMATQDPEGYAHLRPEIVPYAALAVGTPRGTEWIEAYVVEAFPLALLFLACGNVAILLLARAANRSGEVAVRTALGASRARIVSQLFVEALVLACLATGVGLVAIDVLVARFVEPYVGGLFWVDVGVTPELIAKAFLLAVPSAAVAGVLPALRATGAGVSGGLQSMASGAGGIRFGRVSAALIVVEVALGVGCLFAAGMGYRMYRPEGVTEAPSVAAERFLTADISIPGLSGGVNGPGVMTEAHRMRIAERHRTIERRLASEPGVNGVAVAASAPGQRNRGAYVQVDGIENPGGRPGHYTRVSDVGVGFFSALGLSVQRGRGFDDRDLPREIGGPRSVVVVSSVFARRVLGGRNAIGQSIRFVDGPERTTGPAYEIVGVVPRVVTSRRYTAPGEVEAMVYVPAMPGELHPFTLTIDVGEDPASLAPRLREIVAEVDPAALVQDVVPLDEIVDYDVLLGRYVSVFLATLAGISLVLSIAGLYALMSFTVAQRTREIGIRAALGGSPERIVASVAGRAMFQLGLGVGLGAAFWIMVVLGVTLPWGEASPLREWPFVLAVTAAAVIAVGLVACLVPTLRGLRIRPMDALRADG